MRKVIRVGTRDSRLALAQAEWTVQEIQRHHPEIEFQIHPMKTEGDRVLDRPLEQIGGRGLFVKELDAALLNGRADLCVHSFKDLPMEEDPRLPIAALSVREDPRDVLVLPENGSFLEGVPIGSSSARRALFLKELFPSWETRSVRGNVLTRLEKLDKGEYSALVLAAAGLKRIGLAHRISRFFTTDEMLPAACQGILAVQMRAGEDASFLKEFHSPDSAACALTERSFLRAAGGGCSSPCAAFAEVSGGQVILSGSVDGPGQTVLRETLTGPLDRAKELGGELADRLTRRRKAVGL